MTPKAPGLDGEERAIRPGILPARLNPYDMGMLDDWPYLGSIFTRRTTAAEVSVAVWSVIVVVGALGGVCFYFGWQAPADKAAEGDQLMFWGGVLLAAAAAIWLIYRFVLFLMER